MEFDVLFKRYPSGFSALLRIDCNFTQPIMINPLRLAGIAGERYNSFVI
jgi:hypothetical protein